MPNRSDTFAREVLGDMVKLAHREPHGGIERVAVSQIAADLLDNIGTIPLRADEADQLRNVITSLALLKKRDEDLCRIQLFTLTMSFKACEIATSAKGAVTGK